MVIGLNLLHPVSKFTGNTSSGTINAHIVLWSIQVVTILYCRLINLTTYYNGCRRSEVLIAQYDLMFGVLSLMSDYISVGNILMEWPLSYMSLANRTPLLRFGHSRILRYTYTHFIKIIILDWKKKLNRNCDVLMFVEDFIIAIYQKRRESQK